MSAQKTKDIQQATCFLGTTDAASKTHTETFLESFYRKAVTQPFGKHFIRVLTVQQRSLGKQKIFSVFTEEKHS